MTSFVTTQAGGWGTSEFTAVVGVVVDPAGLSCLKCSKLFAVNDEVVEVEPAGRPGVWWRYHFACVPRRFKPAFGFYRELQRVHRRSVV